MISTDNLATEILEWHEARFPNATAGALFIKATEEFGEIAEALSVDIGTNSAKTAADLDSDVTMESADVILCLIALCARYYGEDVLVEVHKKLTKLQTPGAHRSSIQG